MLLEPDVEAPPDRDGGNCLHCGAPVKAGTGANSQFCCSGCAYVYRLVCDRGFGAFYRIKDKVTAPADGVVFEPRNLDWIRTLQARAEGVAGGRPAQAVVDVQGISCAACIWLIERLFREEPGARSIVADAQTGSITLSWTAGRFDAEGWARRLQSFGYLVGPAGETPERLESAVLVKRIGLCAALALNVMLFALPAYFGMRPDFEYAALFRLLSLILATMSVLVGGTYFIGRAVRSLLAGTVHIDLPIAIGIFGAHSASVCGWLMGWPRLFYPDFVATFITLMLVGRWSQVAAVERNRRRLLRHQDSMRVVRLVSGKIIPTREMEKGQRFVVRPGDTVPVDSRLEARAGSFSLASISGEPDPRLFREGETVPSGAVSLDRAESVLAALQPWGQSLLSQLLAPPGRPAEGNSRMELVIKGYLLAIVFGAACVGLVWCLATGDAQRAGEAAISLLVVSCPCALGIALPMADEMATTQARASGVFVREWGLWSRLGRVRKIIFDKTGTLTLENPILLNREALSALGGEERRALIGLVKDSLHPIGRCLHENLVSMGAIEALSGDVREEVGHGVSFGPWSLGRPGWRDRELGGRGTVFAWEGKAIATFIFEDAVRPGAAGELRGLEAKGYRLYILSGDQETKVARLARDLGIPPGQALSSMTPQDKAEWIGKSAPTDALMLGDGANDSMAFDAALCRGTPIIHRGVLETKADFYYLRRDIGGIQSLLAVNSRLRAVKRTVVGFSITYNLAAAGCAAAGMINPLVAAVLMPASSIASLAIVMFGMRAPKLARGTPSGS